MAKLSALPSKTPTNSSKLVTADGGGGVFSVAALKALSEAGGSGLSVTWLQNQADPDRSHAWYSLDWTSPGSYGAITVNSRFKLGQSDKILFGIVLTQGAYYFGLALAKLDTTTALFILDSANVV